MTANDTPSGRPFCSTDQTTLLREFMEEAREHLDSLEPDLLSLENTPASLKQDVINRIFRGIHSIKGSAALVGLATLRDFSHLVENVLLRMLGGDLAPTPERIDVLLAAVDRLRQLIQAGPDAGQVDLGRERESLAALQAPAPQPPPATAPDAPQSVSGPGA